MLPESNEGYAKNPIYQRLLRSTNRAASESIVHVLSSSEDSDSNTDPTSSTDCGNETYCEVPIGTALFLLPVGQRVYTPHMITADGRVELDFEAATLMHDPQFDRFPGATVTLPFGRTHWHGILAKWVQEAGFDLADLMSDAQLCAALILDKSYETVPTWFKIAYVAISCMSLACEVVIAYVEMCSHDGDRLHTLREKHGIVQSLRASVHSWMLRYLAIPDYVDYAAFFLESSYKMRRIYPCAELSDSDARFPVFHDHSSVWASYKEEQNFIAKLPKVILEDLVLFCMNLYLVVILLGRFTSATLISMLFSAYSLFSNMVRFARYVQVAKAYKESLEEEIEHGDQIGHFNSSRISAQVQLDWFRRSLLRRVFFPARPSDTKRWAMQ